MFDKFISYASFFMFVCFSLGNGFGSASVDNETQVCWEGYHIALVCVSMLCFILFYPMAALSTPIWVNRSKGES